MLHTMNHKLHPVREKDADEVISEPVGELDANGELEGEPAVAGEIITVSFREIDGAIEGVDKTDGWTEGDLVEAAFPTGDCDG
jgi:hypothetical protein